jgi:wyosine [tRNA(Phe)-imidazoG37] synthetase (radical SAM superfamily)
MTIPSTRIDPARFHPRTFSVNTQRRVQEFRYVYPVLSRRSKGISIGINPNPDKICNFDCIYCQVDRKTPPAVTKVDMPTLEQELRTLLKMTLTRELKTIPPFNQVRDELFVLRDIALSGDAEPTTSRYFLEIIKTVVRVKRELGVPGLKIVIITNASGLGRPTVKEALLWLDQHNGEIWAKLDAGTETYYKEVDNTHVPLQRVLDNIQRVAKERSIVIQSMFIKHNGTGPTDQEIEAYCGRLSDILRNGGKIKLVQVYTLARRPAEATVTALSREEVDAIAAAVRARTGLATQSYYETI